MVTGEFHSHRASTAERKVFLCYDVIMDWQQPPVALLLTWINFNPSMDN